MGPFLWVKPVPAMPARLARGLLLGRDKRRLVRQALDRSLLRSLIQLTGQCHAGETLGNISAPYAHARRPDDITDPLRATCRGRALSLPHDQKNSTTLSLAARLFQGRDRQQAATTSSIVTSMVLSRFCSVAVVATGSSIQSFIGHSISTM